MPAPRTLRFFVPAALVALGAVAWSATQGFAPPKPGPEHAVLARMAGVWDAKITMLMPAPSESTGTESNALGWDYQQTMMGMTHSMRDVHTFVDADHRRFESYLKSPEGEQKHMQIEYTRRPGGSR
jgi:hypothetical protein